MNKEKLTYFVTGGIAVAFGLFVMVNPAAVINVAAFIFSLGLVARGYTSLRGTLKFDKAARKLDLSGMDQVRKTMLTKTLVSFGLGILALLVSVISLINGSGDIMKASIYIIALGFLANGILGWMESQKFKSYGDVMDAFRDKSFIYILIAVILFVFPFLVGGIVMLIIGGIILLLGCASIWYGWKVVGEGGGKATEVEFTESQDK